MADLNKSENLDDSLVNGEGKDETSFEDKLKNVSVISQPMATKKTASRIYKLIRKASQRRMSKEKDCFWLGLKNVQTKLRKGARGVVIIAGDVSPVDLITHIPAVCEEKGLPYIYIPSRTDIAAAMGKNGGALCCLVIEREDYADSYNKVVEDIKKITKSFEW